MKDKLKGIFRADSLKKVFLHLGVIFLLFLGLLLYFFYGYLPKATHHDETITVPKLEGMDAMEVEKFLEARKLRFKINDSTFSSEVKPNTVLTQHPLADTKVKENRMIYVTIAAKNPPKVAMPQLVDLSLKGALLLLKQHDLVLGNMISVPGQTELIYDQLVGNKKIEPGTMVPKGTKITLKVGNSSGVTVPIPDFTGMDVLSAQSMAEEIGVLIDIRPDPNVTQGTVVKQRPAADGGTVIQTGQTIDVWVE